MPDNWNFEDTLVFETQVLDPYGGAELFHLPFEIPQDENPGYYNFTIYVKLASTGTKVETLELSVKVEYYADFTISMVSDQSTGDPGATHEFAVTIVNNANAAEEVSFAFEDIPSDWTYCILLMGIA